MTGIEVKFHQVVLNTLNTHNYLFYVIYIVQIICTAIPNPQKVYLHFPFSSQFSLQGDFFGATVACIPYVLP